MSKFLQAVILIVIAYLVFKFGLPPLVPRSLLIMYMVFASAAIILYVTSDEESAKSFGAPIKKVFKGENKGLTYGVFAAIALVVGWVTYGMVKPSLEAPPLLRAIHPAPPSSISVYNKSYTLQTLENPFRKLEKEDPAKFAELVREGGVIYMKNCMYCHGDKLNGKGHFATGFNPLPINFADPGTIAMLQESYVFWRASTGGPGLPKESTPWLSAMPVWQDLLTEDDIWKAILFLYDYTGYRPRTWE